MSKAKLKKELKGYPAEALIDLLCDVYDAKVLTAREYLDYYISPNPQVQLERAEKAIVKELSRSKYRRAKFRISQIKKEIARLQALAIEPMRLATLWTDMLTKMVDLSCINYFSDTQSRGTLNFYKALLEYCDRQGVLPQMADAITRVVEPEHEYTLNYDLLQDMRSMLKEFTPSLR